MGGEVSLGGVYMPGLLLLAIVALLLTAVLTRLLGLIGAYRLFAYRPLVDVAIYVIMLGALVLLFASDASLS
ncbi:MAG: DUF1656 domain-containing protein [Sphingomonas bacterium]